MVERCRLHVFGASGTGTTTLGRALADLWSVPHADSDDYFWEPTIPPYRVKRPEAERIPLMASLFLGRGAWVLTGSLMGWGDELVDHFDAVVFLTLDGAVRLRRLEERERTRRAGADAIDDGSHRSFMEWAASYDDPAFDGRSRRGHDRWMETLVCPVLHLDSSRSTRELVRAVLDWRPEGFMAGDGTI